MINFNIISNVASDIIKKRRESGNIIGADDTVCVLCTKTGNIYTGISGLETRNGITSVFHAEIDAVNNMKAHGESVIESVTVFSSSNLAPIIPCNGCLSMIASLAPENINTVILTPTGNLKITDFGILPQNAAPQPQFYQPGYTPAMQPNSMMMNQSLYGYSTPNSVYGAPVNPVMNGNSVYQSAPAQSTYIGGAVPANPAFAASYPSASVKSSSIRSTVSSYAPKIQQSAGNDLLTNKLNNLLDDDEDDELDDIESDNKKKKRRGLFRK